MCICTSAEQLGSDSDKFVSKTPVGGSTIAVLLLYYTRSRLQDYIPHRSRDIEQCYWSKQGKACTKRADHAYRLELTVTTVTPSFSIAE